MAQPRGETFDSEKALCFEIVPDRWTGGPGLNELAIFPLRGGFSASEVAKNFIDAETLVRLGAARGCTVAAPFPLVRLADRLCAHRVEHDVAANFEKVAVLLNEDAFESSLKDMADAAVSFVECLGINAVELSHPLG